VQASATGFYGDTGDRLCDESAPAGSNALANICRQWEAAFAAAAVPATRKVALRIGFVLGRESGALPVLGRLTKYFLGGAVGNGRQFISWIHLADLVQMFVAAVEQENLSGTFNASRRTRSRMRSSCGRCGACCTGRGVRPRRRSR
jgi:NAD dependent epimerase/dehydratase family enzyme